MTQRCLVPPSFAPGVIVELKEAGVYAADAAVCRIRDENGNEVRMDDTQRVALIEESREFVSKNCH